MEFELTFVSMQHDMTLIDPKINFYYSLVSRAQFSQQTAATATATATTQGAAGTVLVL